MVGHLRSKEAAIFKGAEAYRENGEGCLERIDHRFIKERRELVDRCKKDTRLFSRKAMRLMGVMSGGEFDEAERETAMQRHSERLAERQRLYERASASMQSLCNRLLKREGEGGL